MKITKNPQHCPGYTVVPDEDRYVVFIDGKECDDALGADDVNGIVHVFARDKCGHFRIKDQSVVVEQLYGRVQIMRVCG